MSTRPLGQPVYIPDDPGPWSVVTQLVRSRGARPARRYSEPPRGLMLAQPPRVAVPLVGLVPELAAVGAAPVLIVAAAREPAHWLEFEDRETLGGISPSVRRSWSLPHLAPSKEERPAEDPAAALPPPIAPDDLAGDVEAISCSPDGSLSAVRVLEGTRAAALVLRRVEDGAIVRWIRGAMSGAWSADGQHLAVGGEWGVLLLRPVPEESD